MWAGCRKKLKNTVLSKIFPFKDHNFAAWHAMVFLHLSLLCKCLIYASAVIYYIESVCRAQDQQKLD